MLLANPELSAARRHQLAQPIALYRSSPRTGIPNAISKVAHHEL
jgi:hypothetical protein